MLQEVVKQSKRKTRLLEQHAADIEEVAQLTEQLKEQKALSLKLQEKLDGNAATSITGTNTTLEGKTTLNLKTPKGGRTGKWSDGAV